MNNEPNEPTIQQELAIQELHRASDSLNGANDSLDNKAAVLLQSSSIVVGLAGLFSLLNFQATGWPWPLVVGGAVTLASFVVMILLCLKAWKPRDYPSAGKWGDNEIFETYLEATPNNVRRQIIANHLSAISQLKTVNSEKARYIQAAVWSFVIQVLSLLLSLVAAVLLS